MDNLLDELHQMTLDVIERLDSLGYDQMEDFVERRGKITSQLQSLDLRYTDQQKIQIKEILQHDDRIVARMQMLKDEASVGMEKMDRARIQKSAYDPTYAADSYFFDKKK
ncbi:hypothetical protein A8709_20660 [Paenibacillus pectinilyticus]|uniref:Flagellar protein FliT n=1 Tax=Paenibacillus pectinilyticus TaxID=512399 RepID=A0A1C0ZYQ1_9BACL|nr:hypothetical protein [Paenibacillus pectinilyticus]OCT13158.1 hypothetical protein A8709_20660 [Paenibacillus pectinilyticus]